MWKKGRSALNAVAEASGAAPAPADDATPLSQSDHAAAVAASSAPVAAKGKRRGGGGSGPKQVPLLPRQLQAGSQPSLASSAIAAAAAFNDDFADEEDDDDEGAAPVEVSRAGAGEEQLRLHPDDLPRLRVPQLRAALAAAGLSDAGLKAELVARLRGHLLASLEGGGGGEAASGPAQLEGAAPPAAPEAAAESAPASPEQMRAPPDPSRPSAPDASTAAITTAVPVRPATAPHEIIRHALEAAGAPAPGAPASAGGRTRVLWWQGEADPATAAPAAAAAHQQQQQQQQGGGVGPAPLLLLLCETLSLGLPWEGMPLLRADNTCPPSSVCRIPALAWACLPPRLLTAPLTATATEDEAPAPASLLRGGLEALRLYASAGVPSARRAPPASLRRPLPPLPPPPPPSFWRRFSYVINPGGDLGRTQRVLEPLMRALGEAAGKAWGAAAPPPPLVSGLAGRAAAQSASVTSLLALQVRSTAS